MREFRWYHGLNAHSALKLMLQGSFFAADAQHTLEELEEIKMKELPKVYDPHAVEQKIYDMWEKGGYFRGVIDKEKEPFSIVMPPPNVTGQLHMGHALDATLQDILTRYKRMQG